MKFTKYHALGNDYIVVDDKNIEHEITPHEVKVLCERHYGMGSDGILYGPLKSQTSDFALRIFNPDGSEAEKSGNGLRIFSRYLWDCGLVKDKLFSIETKGGEVYAQVHTAGKSVSVDMGRVRFTHESAISVHMPGGIIEINLNKQFDARMKGAVCRIGQGEIDKEAFD